MTTDASRKRSILFTIAVTQFVMPFMFSGVGVTLPAMGAEFGASGVALSLVEAVYIGATAALLLPFGRLADMRGREPMFRLGVLIYAATTLALGFVPDTGPFIALRLVQGLAAALCLATNIAILTDCVAPEERGRALGLAVAAVYLGLSAGPLIGGVITTQLGWRWLYWLGSIPLGVCLYLAARNLEGRFAPLEGRFDWPGSALIAVAVGLFVMGGTHLRSGVWGVSALLAGAACFALFIRVQLRAELPTLDMDLFRANRTFSRAAIVQLLNYSGTFGITFLFSLYLQTVKGLSPQAAGQVLILQPVVQALLSPPFGKLADRFPPQLIAAGGMILCAAGTAIGAMVGPETPFAVLYAMFVVLGVGFAMFSSPNMMILMNSVERSQYGVASALSGGMRNLGMVVSMVLITVALSWYMGDIPVSIETAASYMRAMRLSLAALTLLGVFGVLLSLWPLPKKAEQPVNGKSPSMDG